MKPFRVNRVLALGLLLAIAGPASSAPPPLLRRDDTPVTQGSGNRTVSYADVVGPVLKAVVSIYTTKTVREPINPLLQQFFGDQIPLPEEEYRESGLGSGVIVSPNGYILTNNHVVAGADELTVALSDGRRLKARLVGADEKTDVAVVKIDATHLPTVVIADSDKLRVGDIVFAIGNPLEVGETVTMGIVSAKGRSDLGILKKVNGYENYIQTDAAINLGNSGGALVDAKGRLVGINSAIVSPSSGNVGIGFAIPSNLAAIVMTSLVTTGRVDRGFLGVDGQTVTPDIAEQFNLPRVFQGVIVTDVTPGSPAARGGLRSGDIVEAVGGKPVGELDALRLLVSEHPPGARLAFTVLRNGKRMTIEVTLGQSDRSPDEVLKGVTAAPLTEQLRDRLQIDPRVSGLLVTAVAGDSPYADRIAKNMVIVAINWTAVTDVASARDLIQPGRNLFYVYYQGTLSYLSVSVKK
ncbi:MAG: Do family serine endopeptidase [Opitutaceae bacterium]